MNMIVAQRMTALAALLASMLMPACGLRSTNSSNETLTIYRTHRR
jgi:outer membrane biogenesis lipoprotein LolB